MIGNGKHSYVAKWTCDVCKVQAFDTFEAAEAHEKNCTDQPPVIGVSTPVPTQAVSASVSAAEAGNAAAATPIDLTNELSNGNGGGSARNETEQNPPPAPAHPVPTPSATVGALAGESEVTVPAAGTAAASMLAAVSSSASAAQGRSGSLGTKRVAASAVWTCDYCFLHFATYQEATEHEEQCKLTTSKAAASAASDVALDANQKCWTCDMCNNAHFPTFEEAEAHEATCKGNPDAPLQNISIQREGGSSTGAEDASQLTEPNLDETSNCVLVASGAVVDPPLPQQPMTQSSPHQQQQSANPPSAPLAPPPQPSPPSQKTTIDSLVNPKSSSIGLVPPGAMFPLIHDSFDRSLSLSPRNGVFLNQFVFSTSNNHQITASNSPVEICLSCKHCSKMFRAPSVEKLYTAVNNGIRNHIDGGKTCLSMPADVRDLLFDMKKCISDVQPVDTTSIRDYCQYLIRSYSIVNISRTNDVNNSSIENRPSSIGIASSGVASALKVALPMEKVSKKEKLASKHADGNSDSGKRMTRRRSSKSQRVDIDGNDTHKKKRRSFVDGTRPRLLDRDSDGNEYYIPPVGGVPLVSSQSIEMFVGLPKYHQLILENLELYEVESKDQDGEGQLVLRCQNCNANPHLSTLKYIASVQDFEKDLRDMEQHVRYCPCLSAVSKQEIESERAIVSGGLVTKQRKIVVSYCKSLISLYGMKDGRSGAKWGKCPPIEYDNIVSPETKRIPQHDLMISGKKRPVLLDYIYLQVAQFKLALLPRQSPSSVCRPCNLSVALCCQHCNYTKLFESLRDSFVSSAYALNFHLRACHSDMFAKRLDELKESSDGQESQRALNMSKYMRHVIVDTYGMTDLEWNGVSGGVGFSDANDDVLNELDNKFGKSRFLKITEGVKMNHRLTLPLLAEADPFTSSLSADNLVCFAEKN